MRTITQTERGWACGSHFHPRIVAGTIVASHLFGGILVGNFRAPVGGLLVLAVFGILVSTLSAAQTATSEIDRADRLPLAVATDLNSDPRIVEIELTAVVADVEILPGRRVKAWTYNGAIPGPLIRVDVGDRLIVRFTNRLPAATTVHWHGLRVPAQMDGVPGHSQPEVAPGGTFTYDFIVPDAGLYWYHPHVMSAAQVGFGLYGAFLVNDPSDGVGISTEQVLVLSDIDLTASGELESPETGGSTGMAFGREGNVLLVNGRNQPRMTARSGVTERWRIVNAAKSRYFHLDPGADQPFTKIGGDGGLQEYSVEQETLVLAPGERADVLVTLGARPGTDIPVAAHLFDRGYGSVEARIGETLFTIVLDGTPASPRASLPKVTRRVEPLNRAGATDVAIEFGIAQQPDKTFYYTINGKPLGKFPPISATVGETQVWTITNTTPWSHPFHLHGFFFQVWDKTGQPVRPLEWKDTVSVPYKSSLQVVVRYDDRPGTWMFHCHILDHADGGLMSTVRLTRAGEAAAPADHDFHKRP
jgi:FtsP/CotA-like multicopper oxidase with cupredoxin domain